MRDCDFLLQKELVIINGESKSLGYIGELNRLKLVEAIRKNYHLIPILIKNLLINSSILNNILKYH